MSLNRAEQMLLDYVQTHQEERQFLLDKVRAIAREQSDEARAVRSLESELWRYYEERSRVVSPFREMAAKEGLRRISMKNLAEYWLRLWTEPRPKPPSPPAFLD